MTEVDTSVYSRAAEPEVTGYERKPRTEVEELKRVRQYASPTVAQPQEKTAVPSEQPLVAKATEQSRDAEDALLEKLKTLSVDSIVLHKKFGRGTVVKLDKHAKFIHIKFTLGEKKFIFPDAFLMGFLEVR